MTSFYDDTPQEGFSPDFRKLVKFGNIEDGDTGMLTDPTGINLAKLAASQSDGIILGSSEVAPEIVSYCEGLNVPMLPFSQEAMESGAWIDEYNSFYDKL